VVIHEARLRRRGPGGPDSDLDSDLDSGRPCIGLVAPLGCLYARLKHRLAAEFRSGRDGCTQAKTAFVQHVLRLAGAG
jgi:hypothetical protein